MNKVKAVLILLVIGMMTTACSTTVNKTTTTHVKDLVQSDVFGVLPESNQEIMIYNNPEEIGGEYLELATVKIQETARENSTQQQMMEMLKKEAKELGGNGLILIESSSNEKGSTITKEVKAIAVYALDKIPAESQLVLL